MMTAAVVSAILMSSGCAAPKKEPEIHAVLDAQVDAWNAGDLQGYMAGYWNSPELEFSTPKGVTHGWQETLKRYRKSYPDAAAMGRLQFDGIEIARTGEDSAEVAGQFTQKVGDKTQTGRFFLHMRRIDGEWVITRDRTVGN